MELLICPEPHGDNFEVRLWTVATHKDGVEVHCAPSRSWLSYARIFEAAQTMSEAMLGRVDACIARGESVRYPLRTALEGVGHIGFEPVAAAPDFRGFAVI